MGLTAEELEFITLLQQPNIEEEYSDIQYNFEDKLVNIKSSVIGAKQQLLTVQDHLNALEDASKQLKEQYLQHQHSFIELSNILNWFDVVDDLIVILRSGTPVLQAVNGHFNKMYSDVDKCHDYLLSHPDYKLTKEYLPTVRVVITKTLTMYSLAFTESINQISTEVKSIATAQSNFEEHLGQLQQYTIPLFNKKQDIEFRQIYEDTVEAFFHHRNQSIRQHFTNFEMDQASVIDAIANFTRLMKSFLRQEAQLFEKIFNYNFINYNQMYSSLIQTATKSIVEFVAINEHPDALLEIRLLLNSELIASELDNKSKLVLLEGVGDLSNYLNKN